jgi:hypothetical protein
MASPPTLSNPDKTDWIDVDAPLLLQLQSIIMRPVRLAYQPPASSTFLSQQTSHQQCSSLRTNQHQPSATSQPNRLMAPAGAAASSSPKFQEINVSAGETERTELENVSYNVVLHAFFYVGK